jgi:RND family efflux transporter MFP subunit
LVDLAQIRVDQSTFDLNLAQEMLKESEIRAPYDGTLFRVNSEPNEFVMAGTAIVSFLLDQSYYAEVFIYEGDIIDVSIGNPVEIEIVAFPKEVFFGEVAFIDQAPKIIDGIVNYKVLISIENLPEEVMFGMTSDVTIITKKKESVIFIPESYIKDNSVLLVSDDGFVKTSVEIGMKSTDRNVEILSGLREGDRLVTLK